MSDKKNIDQLFKDKLEHFDVAPPEMAWKNIETKLKEKEEKRRVIPFWWKFAGAAAILLLGFGLYTALFDNPTPTENPIVHQDSTATDSNKAVTDRPNATLPQKENGDSDKENTNSRPNGDVVATNPSAEKRNNAASSNENNAGNNAVVSASNNRQNSSSSIRKINTVNEKTANSNGSLALKAPQSDAENKMQKVPDEKLNAIKENYPKSAIANNEPKSKSTYNEIKQPSTNKDIQNTTIDKNTTLNTIDSKSDIAVTPNKSEEIKKIDSTKLAAVEPNALEELLTEKEKKITTEQKVNRWQVTPNVAPIYFRSLSNGSPLDSKLEANEKVYGTNYSYGLAVDYKLNNKYSIRTGVHSYSVDYDTKDIVFYQDTNASKMQNVNPNTQGAYIQIEPLTNVTTSFGRILGEKFEGTLNQRTSYIEIPFEMTYKLFSRKFGVDVIGGVSTLFLNQNDVYLKSTSFNMKIGEASNLNTFHFSTNIGLGLKYSFLKRFDARVEPLFKYQINTYSSGAGNFKPYVFGIYSGISYRF